MGPRLFKRGNPRIAPLRARICLCFNGATPLQAWKQSFVFHFVLPRTRLQWGHASSSVETSLRERSLHTLQRGFNGATPLQAWKPNPTIAIDTGPPRLQWGHASSSVETRVSELKPGDRLLASMGPRLFKRGNPAFPLLGDQLFRASMGPRLFKRGNGRSKARIRTAPAASMGPRLFKRGNNDFIAGDDEYFYLLQWGHASSSVETLS